MPTGFTAALYEGEQDFATFARTTARAFLGHLRDTPLGPELPKPQVSSHLAEMVATAAEEEVRWARMSGQEIAEEFAREAAKVRRELESEKRTTDARKARYQAMLQEVDAWDPPTPEHEGLKTYMTNQLVESISHDCRDSSYAELREAEFVGGAEAWHKARLEAAKQHLARMQERIVEEKERVASTGKWIEDLETSLPT